jgi:NADPH2:quinone reductase
MLLGADLVIAHGSNKSLKQQLDEKGIDGVDYIFNGYDTAVYLDQYAAIIKPFGKIVSIVETDKPLNMTQFMMKRVTFSWEFMFARPLFGGEDMIQQHHILESVASLIDNKVLECKVQIETPYTIENLRKAHKEIESGHSHGKIILYKT